MSFAEHLAQLLPNDLPNRDNVIEKSALHLERIVETNRQFNLTRILDEREAAIKHVLDSVLPWRWFADARDVFDVGTGAGFPGIPLALVLPHVRFTLIESTGKKARFVEETTIALALPNTSVAPRRAEEVLRTRRDVVVTARAVAPLIKASDLFGPAAAVGCRVLLYKGPEVEAEIADAALRLRKLRTEARIVERYTLPDELGARTLVEIARL